MAGIFEGFHSNLKATPKLRPKTVRTVSMRIRRTSKSCRAGPGPTTRPYRVTALRVVLGGAGLESFRHQELFTSVGQLHIHLHGARNVGGWPKSSGSKHGPLEITDRQTSCDTVKQRSINESLMLPSCSEAPDMQGYLRDLGSCSGSQASGFYTVGHGSEPREPPNATRPSPGTLAPGLQALRGRPLDPFVAKA